MPEDLQEEIYRFRDPFDLVNLPRGSERVEDPEEEVFLLYTRLSSKGAQDGSNAFTGLGFVDSKHDELLLTFDLPPPNHEHPKSEQKLSSSLSSSSKRQRKRHHAHKAHLVEPISLEIELAQDNTALRSKKGDTGSVVWRVSVWLCQLLLRQLCSNLVSSLLDRDKLRESTVLELGAGTGLLSLVIAPWVRHYIITDLDYLLPLIRKNITHNKANILRELSKSSGFVLQPDTMTVDSLDWMQLLHTAAASRHQLFRLPPLKQDVGTPEPQLLDLIFAVDCIFNPSLLPGLVETIDHFAVPGRTKVVVSVELRSEEVIREFLELWLGKGGWEVWRVGDLSDGNGEQLDVSFAIWVGMKIGK